MRVLIVCSGNSGEASPFVREQGEQLRHAGCDVRIFLIKGKGWRGYLSNRVPLQKCMDEFKPDILHAHSGMSALLAGLQRRIPVVATFHGSDVNVPRLRLFTRLAMFFTQAHIVVSTPMKQLLGRESIHVIPCAVNDQVFYPSNKRESRKQLGWSDSATYIVFSSAFDNPVKNARLAQEAVELLSGPDVHLMELKGKTRSEVALMLNAADAALMTSFTEGSPQFIKEAMACGAPIVSTPVGDVPELCKGLEGHFVVDYNAEEIKQALRKAIQFREEHTFTKGPEWLRKRNILPVETTKRIMDVYTEVLRR